MAVTRPLIATACIAFAGSCAAVPANEPGNPASTEAPAASGLDVRVGLGQSALIDRAGLTVTLAAIESDSRCPKGETCAWEGSGTIRLSVKGGAGSKEFVLHTSRRAGPGSAIYDGWKIELTALEPYPLTGRTFAPEEYSATLRATK